MSVFDDVEITWEGKTRTIPAEGIMKTIARVEDIITMGEIFQYSERGAAPMGKLSMAFTVCLQVAGFEVDSDQVYKALFQGNDAQKKISATVQALLAMMIPPADLDVETSEGGEDTPPPKKTPAKSSSKQPTRRR